MWNSPQFSSVFCICQGSSLESPDMAFLPFAECINKYDYILTKSISAIHVYHTTEMIFLWQMEAYKCSFKRPGKPGSIVQPLIMVPLVLPKPHHRSQSCCCSHSVPMKTGCGTYFSLLIALPFCTESQIYKQGVTWQSYLYLKKQKNGMMADRSIGLSSPSNERVMSISPR